MKELDAHKIDQVKAKTEIRQVLKEERHLDKFRLSNGEKVWEMVCIPDKPGEPVLGLTAEGFDPDLALIRVAEYQQTVATAISPVRQLLGKTGLGKIQPGIQRKLKIRDGNIYEKASNIKNARRKIIAKYFPKQ